MSKSDIHAGDRWQEALGKELEACNFGILCITRQNLHSPWLTFEAGSLAKARSDSRVIPLLLDLDEGDITGPLSQFQAKKADKPGIEGMIESINNGSEPPVPEAKIKELFELLWPKLEEQLSVIPDDAGGTPPKRSSEEILEELVSSIRSLESHVRRSSDGIDLADSLERALLKRRGFVATQVLPDRLARYFRASGESMYLSLKEWAVLSDARSKTPLDETADALGVSPGEIRRIRTELVAKLKAAHSAADDFEKAQESGGEEEK
jgi:hypothetical protein